MAEKSLFNCYPLKTPSIRRPATYEQHAARTRNLLNVARYECTTEAAAVSSPYVGGRRGRGKPRRRAFRYGMVVTGLDGESGGALLS